MQRDKCGDLAPAPAAALGLARLHNLADIWLFIKICHFKQIITHYTHY